jgi:hypothetical protein
MKTLPANINSGAAQDKPTYSFMHNGNSVQHPIIFPQPHPGFQQPHLAQQPIVEKEPQLPGNQ